MNDDPALRTLSAMGPEECWALLGDEGIGRVAVTIRRHPFIFPVYYRVDHAFNPSRSIAFRTADGAKLDGLLAGPSVAFEVDSLDQETGRGWSVVADGSVSIVAPEAATALPFRFSLDTWDAANLPVVARITPSSISGRRLD